MDVGERLEGRSWSRWRSRVRARSLNRMGEWREGRSPAVSQTLSHFPDEASSRRPGGAWASGLGVEHGGGHEGARVHGRYRVPAVVCGGVLTHGNREVTGELDGTDQSPVVGRARALGGHSAMVAASGRGDPPAACPR